MGSWGDRFALVGSFINYCRGLRVETNQDELEFYEKTGAMLPVARVVYPNEYAIQRDQSLWTRIPHLAQTSDAVKGNFLAFLVVT